MQVYSKIKEKGKLKKILTLAIISLLLLSTFSILVPQVKAGVQTSSTGLYAGSTNSGVVWKYKGGTNWESITENPQELGWSVTSIITYDGKLYAGAITAPDISLSSGKVWKYEGAKAWTLINDGLVANQVTFLIIYKGELYAGTATPARLYKYNPSTTSWTKVLEYTSWYGFRSAYVWGDWLYLGEWYWDRFARWNGATFEEFQPQYWGSCSYSIEEYGDYLFAGAYGGNIYRLAYQPPVATWIWNPPQWQYAWALKTYQNKLYIGLDAGGTGSAPLYKYDGNLARVYDNPVWTYETTSTNPHEGIISMTTDESYLYIGVGGEAVGYPSYMSAEGIGRVYRYDGTNTPTPISEALGTGVQVLYAPSPRSIEIERGQFTATFYYCVYNSEIEGTQTCTKAIPDKRLGQTGEITLTLKASFWFGGKGVPMQGTGRTEAGGLYVKYEYDSGGGWVRIGSPEWKAIVAKRYEKLGITDFTGFGNLALRFPEMAKYSVVQDVRGAYGRQLVPWYSIAAPSYLRGGTIGRIEFLTGETLTPPITPSGKTWMLFKVDDTGGSIKDRRIDIYLGEGNEAAVKWSLTGGNRQVRVYQFQKAGI
jgi:3D (Asp-Asp-Asp) domain-containing protein